MKKFLLGTTAMFGAALLAAAANAEDPKVLVGGVIDFQAGWADDSDPATLDGRDYGFRNDSELTVEVAGRSDAGLGYGAVLDLETDITADVDAEGLNGARTYVYLDGGFGRFEMGGNTGSEYALKVDASNLARATGGIDGSFYKFTDFAGGTNAIIRPRLLQAHGGLVSDDVDFAEESINSTKLTYYTPRFSGFQAGVSYVPALEDRGQAVRTLGGAVSDMEDVIAAGVNYEGAFQNIGLAAALTGETGDADVGGAEDLQGWNAGATLTWTALSIGGSYGEVEGGTYADGDYYTLGASYDFGPFGASATWLDSSAEAVGLAGENDFENLSVGVDYMLAPGLTPYAEVSFFDLDAGIAGDASNDGTIVILGTELAF